MYLPTHFNETDQTRIATLIRDFGFATLISTTAEGAQVTHAPIQLDSARNVLVGHIARANPHAESLQNGAQMLVIFHGPHSYISPTWYISENEKVPNVPTWNYAAVHVTGTVTRIDDEAAKWKIVSELAAQYEGDSASAWDPRGLDAHVSKLSAIVGFEIDEQAQRARLHLHQAR